MEKRQIRYKSDLIYLLLQKNPALVFIPLLTPHPYRFLKNEKKMLGGI